MLYRTIGIRKYRRLQVLHLKKAFDTPPIVPFLYPKTEADIDGHQSRYHGVSFAPATQSINKRNQNLDNLVAEIGKIVVVNRFYIRYIVSLLQNLIMKSIFLSFVLSIIGLSLFAQKSKTYNLSFKDLAKQWDEAIPLGNGMIGALIWDKENTIRLSLDRADLWDERKAFPIEEHTFEWVTEQVKKQNLCCSSKMGRQSI